VATFGCGLHTSGYESAIGWLSSATRILTVHRVLGQTCEVCAGGDQRAIFISIHTRVFYRTTLSAPCRTRAQGGLHLVAPHVLTSIDAFTGSHCAQVLWAFAHAGVLEEELMKQLVVHIGRRPRAELAGRDAATVLWASAQMFKRCGWQPPDLVQVAEVLLPVHMHTCAHARRVAGVLLLHGICWNLLWTSSHVAGPIDRPDVAAPPAQAQQDLSAPSLQLLHGQVSDLDHVGLTSSLFGLASVPPSTPLPSSLLEALDTSCAAHLSSSKPPEVVQQLAAFASLRFLPAAFLTQLAVSETALLPAFNNLRPQHSVALMWALSELDPQGTCCERLFRLQVTTIFRMRPEHELHDEALMRLNQVRPFWVT
jgi:hypothetical protein